MCKLFFAFLKANNNIETKNSSTIITNVVNNIKRNFYYKVFVFLELNLNRLDTSYFFKSANILSNC